MFIPLINQYNLNALGFWVLRGLIELLIIKKNSIM